MKFFSLIIIMHFVLLSFDTNAQGTTSTPLVEETSTEKNDTTIYTYVDQWPSFPGGRDAQNRFLAKNMVYPKEAEKRSIEGRVILSFIVEKDGTITNIKIIKGVDPLLDNEALRVVKKMPSWEPAKNKGELVRIKHKIDLVYKLPE